MSDHSTSPRLRAVSFDAAGTLIHVAAPVADTYAAIAETHGISIDADAIARNFKTLFPRMSPLAFGQCSDVERDRQERSWWKTLVRNCLGPAGGHAQFGTFFDALYAHYATPDAWRVYPEVEGVLDALATAGVGCVVTSNFDSRLPGVLRSLGLAERFAAIVYSSAAGSAKPDAAIFAQACRALGVTAGNALHVGDDRRADFEGARTAGLTACWLRRDAPAVDGEHSVDSLDAIAARLGSARPRRVGRFNTPDTHD